MIDLWEKAARNERAMLLGIKTEEQNDQDTEDLLVELAELTETFGARVIDRCIVRLDKPNPRYLIGNGKASEVARRCRQQQIDVLIFDDSLSPSQQRNWEKLAKLRVIDRQEVILDIFCTRASTQEAVLQVSLAQAEYLLPRLKRAWTHLSRQRGGVGLRGGEGEAQIEVDARLVRDRITKLRRDLVNVRKRRAEQRKKRQKKPVPNAAIVGYTNAGKSSLLNVLSDADVFVEDKLFATLDPTTRRIRLQNNQTLLLTDTVGFVRKLPHNLVEAFKSTLEEAAVGDFLVHVLDASAPAVDEHVKTTERVLEEIGAGCKEIITVFNKVDLLTAPYMRARLRRRYPDAVFISTKTGKGLADLMARMREIVDDNLETMDLRIPQSKYDLVALLHRTSHVLSERYEDDAIYVRAAVPPDSRTDFQPYEDGEV